MMNEEKRIEIKRKFVENFRKTGDAAKENKKETDEKKEGLSEEIKKEIGQHLKNVRGRLRGSLIRGLSAETIEEIGRDIELVSNAWNQLTRDEGGREEILKVILEFPTEAEREAQYALGILFRLAPLNPDGAKSIEEQKIGIEKYIEEEGERRKGWADYIKNEWGKKK